MRYGALRRISSFLINNNNHKQIDMSFRFTSSSHYKNRLFESPPMAGFQITDFGVSRALGAGNTKIGFIMRIAVGLLINLSFDLFSESQIWIKQIKMIGKIHQKKQKLSLRGIYKFHSKRCEIRTHRMLLRLC